MKEQDEIDHLFKSAFDDFAAPPPAAVKEAVDLAIALKRKQKFVRWFYSGLAVFVLLFVTGIAMLDYSENQQQVAAQNSGTAQNAGSAGNTAQNSSASSGQAKTQNSSKNNSNHSVDKTGDQPANAKSPVAGNLKNNNTGTTGVSAGLTGKTLNGGNAKSETGSTQKIKKSKKKNSGKKGDLLSGEHSFDVIQTYDIAERGKTGKDSESETSRWETTDPKPEQKLTDPKSSEQKAGMQQKQDSTQTAEETFEEEKPDPKKKTPGQFLLSVRPGTTFGFNRLTTNDTLDAKLKEKDAFHFQAEATYLFRPNLGITSGINYGLHTEELSQKTTATDSVITGYSTEYILDSAGQVIIDSITVPIYNIQYSQVTGVNSYRIYSVGIPVLFTYSLPISTKLNLDLSGGAVMSIQGSKIISESLYQDGATVNKFGAKLCLRTQLRYQFSAWGVSLNTNFGYDIIPVNTWSMNRSRTYLELGAGVHYLLGK